MSVRLKFNGNDLNAYITISRIEGKNSIFEALVEDGNLPKDVEYLVFDLANVDYINSLGIAEFISIHRYFASVNQGKTRMKFINVDKKIAQLFQMVELGSLSEVEEKRN